jgi:hypothetical protein
MSMPTYDVLPENSGDALDLKEKLNSTDLKLRGPAHPHHN